MFIGNDIAGNRIDVDSSIAGQNYFCPACGAPLVKKLGEVRIHHFAHANGSECDTWSNDMSEWHRNWQERFPVDSREIVITLDGETHRADVLFNNTVIEFQHSPMTADEFEERNTFYSKAGYSVVWLFDATEQYKDGKIERHDFDKFKYRWKWGPHTFDNYNPVENLVRVFLQFKLGEDGQASPEIWQFMDRFEDFEHKKYYVFEQEKCGEAICYDNNEFIAFVGSYDENRHIEEKRREEEAKKIAEEHAQYLREHPGKSIVQILYESKANVVGIRNIITDVRVKLGTYQREYLSNRRNALGYFGRLYGGGYYKDRREIFYSYRPVWELEWER